MAIKRMQQLAREYVYEPDRGVADDPGLEPVRSEAHEIPVRINGCRVFVATDDRGEVCGVGLMEPGGDKRRLAAQLYATIDAAVSVPLMKVV